MPVKGQIITIPTSGDSYEFIETSKESNGACVVMKATIFSQGPLVPNHFHLLQDETFEVHSGQLTVWTEGKTTVYHPGEKVVLPKNIHHNHFNAADEPVTYIHTVTPGLDFDYLIENLVGLAADGIGKNGKYGIFQELVSLRYLDSKSYLADIPVGLQKILMYVIAPVGRFMGYKAIYRKYSGIEK